MIFVHKQSFKVETVRYNYKQFYIFVIILIKYEVLVNTHEKYFENVIPKTEYRS